MCTNRREVFMKRLKSYQESNNRSFWKNEMHYELLLSVEKQTDKLIEQKRTKPQETLEFILINQMDTLWVNPPINFSEEGKWLLAVTISEAAKSVFIAIHGNNSFSITTPGPWTRKCGEETIDKLVEILTLRSPNDMQLNLTENEKRVSMIVKRKFTLILILLKNIFDKKLCKAQWSPKCGLRNGNNLWRILR